MGGDDPVLLLLYGAYEHALEAYYPAYLLTYFVSRLGCGILYNLEILKTWKRFESGVWVSTKAAGRMRRR